MVDTKIKRTIKTLEGKIEVGFGSGGVGFFKHKIDMESPSNTEAIDTNRITQSQKSLADLPLPTTVHLDSCKFTVPADAIVELSPSATTSHPIIDDETDEVIGSCRKVKRNHLAFGVKSVVVHPGADEVVIELSAKVLRERYFELITHNTIEQALDYLNESNGIILNKTFILEHGQLLRVDATSDLYVSCYPPDYILALQLSLISPRYQVENYYSDESVIFTSRAKTNRSRLSIYRKYPELHKRKNQKLRHYLDPKRYWHMIRVEQNLKSFKLIKNAFGVKDRFISEVLKSDRNPNHVLFLKIMPTVLPISEEYYSIKRSHREMIKREGMKQVIERFDHDFPKIREFVSRFYPGKRSNPSRIFREYKDLLNEQHVNNLLKFGLYSLVNEIERRLKHAWDECY